MLLDMYLASKHPMSSGTTVEILIPVNEMRRVLMYLTVVT